MHQREIELQKTIETIIVVMAEVEMAEATETIITSSKKGMIAIIIVTTRSHVRRIISTRGKTYACPT